MGSINQEQSLDWVSVTYTSNPVYMGGSNKEDLSKNFMRPHLNQWLGTMVHLSFHLLGGAEIGGSWPRHKVRPCLKGWSGSSGTVPA
jgi:hypothetical protein